MFVVRICFFYVITRDTTVFLSASATTKLRKIRFFGATKLWGNDRHRVLADDVRTWKNGQTQNPAEQCVRFSFDHEARCTISHDDIGTAESLHQPAATLFCAR